MPEEEEENRVEQAFEIVGGFGRFQKFAYFINTLSNASAAFFLYSFVYLEKEPVYECLTVSSVGERHWERCGKAQICHPTKN